MHCYDAQRFRGTKGKGEKWGMKEDESGKWWEREKGWERKSGDEGGREWKREKEIGREAASSFIYVLKHVWQLNCWRNVWIQDQIRVDLIWISSESYETIRFINVTCDFSVTFMLFNILLSIIFKLDILLITALVCN